MMKARKARRWRIILPPPSASCPTAVISRSDASLKKDRAPNLPLSYFSDIFEWVVELVRPALPFHLILAHNPVLTSPLHSPTSRPVPPSSTFST